MKAKLNKHILQRLNFILKFIYLLKNIAKKEKKEIRKYHPPKIKKNETSEKNIQKYAETFSQKLHGKKLCHKSIKNEKSITEDIKNQRTTLAGGGLRSLGQLGS